MIQIVPFDMKYLEDYYRGFNAEITKYQWPDPFESADTAREMLEGFLEEMDRGETLLYSILSEDGTFLGSAEIHGLDGDCPEVGVWIREPEQNKGYAYTALKAAMETAREKTGCTCFFYEADVRNTGSMKLLRKFSDAYDIIDQGVEKLTTDSGKELELQAFELRVK